MLGVGARDENQNPRLAGLRYLIAQEVLGKSFMAWPSASDPTWYGGRDTVVPASMGRNGRVACVRKKGGGTVRTPRSTSLRGAPQRTSTHTHKSKSSHPRARASTLATRSRAPAETRPNANAATRGPTYKPNLEMTMGRPTLSTQPLLHAPARRTPERTGEPEC